MKNFFRIFKQSRRKAKVSSCIYPHDADQFQLTFTNQPFQLTLHYNKINMQQQNMAVRDSALSRNLTPLVIKQSEGEKQYNSYSISKQLGSPLEVDSPLRKKKANLMSHKKVSEVEVAHSQLNKYIDVLDNKVTKLVEKHQAQFLVAYRNHIKKVREEMEEIRNRALNNANSTVSQTQKIEALQKQLTVFRQQSLKLFEKVNEKEGVIYNLKTKLSQIESQKQFLEQSVRQLTKRNKVLQGLQYEAERKSNFDQPKDEKQFFISKPMLIPEATEIDMNRTGISFMKSRPYTTAIVSKGASIRARNHSIQISRNSKIEKVNNVGVMKKEEAFYIIDQVLASQTHKQIILRLKSKLSDIVVENGQGQSLTGEKKISNQALNQRRSSKMMHSKNHAEKAELEQYFYKSIEAVRKQITRRRGLKSMNFYSQYANLTIAQFKKIDFFRLLELLLSHQKIITVVHDTIFNLQKGYN